MTTKIKIVEQVLYRINGGMQAVNSPVQQEDVIEALAQLINTTFKTQNYNDVFQAGDTITNGYMIATYEDIAVVSMGGLKSYALLPVQPVSLPRDMGVNRISNLKDFSTFFIPLQPGQQEILSGIPLINDLLGQIGYERYGNKVIFTKDITTLEQNIKVHMRLVVFEMSQYGDTDTLPIPADMETDIVDQLIQRFAPVIGKLKVADIIEPTPNSK